MLTVKRSESGHTWDVWDEDREELLEGGFFALSAALQCAEEICSRTGQSFRVRNSR